MKKFRSALGPLVGFACLCSGALAAENEKAAKSEKQEMRVLAAPEAGKRAHIRRGGTPLEKETVTFLGVETAPASATLAAQLGLPKGAGLVVRAVMPESPAEGVLELHDILLKFEDQLLIEQRQLSVLIRQRKPGDEVTLTLLRGGKQTTAKVKLASHEVPKISQLFTAPFNGAHGFAFGADNFEWAAPFPGEGHESEDVDRVLALIDRRSDEPVTIRIDGHEGPGFRAMKVLPENSNLVFSDDAGSLELTFKEGEKTLVAKDPKGAELFSGPVTTPEERAAMPESVRERLEKLEGMHDITFKTDEAFRGTERKIVRPLGRGVSYPHSGARVAPPRPSAKL